MRRKVEIYVFFLPCGCVEHKGFECEGVEEDGRGQHELRALSEKGYLWLEKMKRAAGPEGPHGKDVSCRIIASIKGQSYKISEYTEAE